MRFEEKQTEMRYGIAFWEDPGAVPNYKFFDNESDRDADYDKALESGMIRINYGPIARTVLPIHFGKIELAATHHARPSFYGQGNMTALIGVDGDAARQDP